MAHVEHAYFDSAGVRLHYVAAGHGEPVLLLHGFLASVRFQWGPMLPLLQRRHRVIALDIRGHGRSDKPHDARQYGLALVDDALRLLDHLHVERAHVVGYSLGAFITLHLIAAHADRLRSATLGGAGLPRALRSQVPALADALEQGRGLAPLLDVLSPSDRAKPKPAEVALLNQLVRVAYDTQALAACLRGLSELSAPDEQLRANRVPALALIGERDPFRADVAVLGEVLSNLETRVIADADHLTAFAQSEFAERLTDFLERHGEEAPRASETNQSPDGDTNRLRAGWDR